MRKRLRPLLGSVDDKNDPNGSFSNPPYIEKVAYFKGMRSLMKITKAVFPVAGLGTRFLPATKANPKEMLPIVDKPLIQYAVEEAISAGVTQLIFVTSSSKRAIEDHFDSNFELESRLREAGKWEMLEIVQGILPAGVSCAYIRQQSPLGLGHAVWCAKPLLNNESFAVLLADDLIDHPEKGCLAQMMDVYQATQNSLIAVEKIRFEDTGKYGVVALDAHSSHPKRIAHIVEKPTPAEAPSQLGVVGRYILTPGIFNSLEKMSQRPNSEIQLTDAIAHLLQTESVHAVEFSGKRYDCGSKLGYLQATLAYALKHKELAASFKETLKEFEVCLIK